MNGKCVDTNILIDIAYVYSVGAAVTDFTVGLLPAFMIWNLRMSPRDKIAVAGILGVGCMFVSHPDRERKREDMLTPYRASAAVIVRIPYIHNYKDIQFLYKTTSISIWSNIEAGLGITAGSLTTLRPLIRFFREASHASRRSRSRNPGSFPLASTLGNTPNYQLKTDPEDAHHFWMGQDLDHGVHTVVMGNGRVIAAAAGANSSEEDLFPNPRRMIGSPQLAKR